MGPLSVTASKPIIEEITIFNVLANFRFLYLLQHSLKRQQLCLEIHELSTSEMAQWIRAPMAKPDKLSLSLRTDTVEEENCRYVL